MSTSLPPLPFPVAVPESTSAPLSHPVGNLQLPHTSALIAAQNDTELIQTYLNRGGLAPRSIANTAKELDRFSLWCHRQGLSFRTVRSEDLVAYSAFVMDPQPAAEWISPTKWPRNHPNWRPFSGPLSEASARQAFIAIRALFRWAADAKYLAANPAALLGKMKREYQDRVTRYLPREALSLAYQAIEAMDDRTPSARRRKARNRFLFMAYAQTGCRLSELLEANMGDLYAEEGQWWLRVMGKGRKPRILPVPEELRIAFEKYRTEFGLPPRAIRIDPTPMVLSSRGSTLRATQGMVDDAVKGILKAAARRAAELGNVDLSSKIEMASTHWLRHTLFTHLANDGEVPLPIIQATAGHEKLSTTGLYLHAEDKIRHQHILAALRKAKEMG